MKKLLFLLFAIPLQLVAQTKDELDLCMAIQANSFTSNTEAENALDRILDVIGASKNFVLTPCDKISNAVATAYKGTRYILYDREFMNQISKNTNDWSNLFIFAHEVGHHINGHSIDLLLYTNDVVDAPSLEKSRQQELEADEFAAFILAKLGANLSQLNNVITLISDNSDDSYSTHPKREKRLASVKKGFDKGYEPKNLNSLPTAKAPIKEQIEIIGGWKRKVSYPANEKLKKLDNTSKKNPFNLERIYRSFKTKIIEAQTFNGISYEKNSLLENGNIGITFTIQEWKDCKKCMADLKRKYKLKLWLNLDSDKNLSSFKALESSDDFLKYKPKYFDVRLIIDEFYNDEFTFEGSFNKVYSNLNITDSDSGQNMSEYNRKMKRLVDALKRGKTAYLKISSRDIYFIETISFNLSGSSNALAD
ncbi:M48 family metalloprotease [Flavobacteriaceae bacterium]|nr:M48 family metalloprotease [Flavobacteriaceae bacterium]